MNEIILPWWPKELKRNGDKYHWGAVSKAAKSAKDIAWVETLRHRNLPKFPESGDIDLEVTFHPKTRNKIDRDNCVASCKHYFDGIALAWEVDDSRFAITPRIGGPVKGGRVVVRYG